MNLHSKINNLKEGSIKTLKKVRSLSISDVWKTYRSFLKRIPDISHLKNIVLFSGIATLMIFIFFANRFNALYQYLPKKPLYGGIYKEGIVGRVEQLDPLFTPSNSAEDTVASLMFSGLTKKDGNRKAIPDLAESWEISPDGKVYTFKLRDNLFWDDGHSLTADDVVFTITTIQNPDVRSPLFEMWKDIEVSASDPKTVIFKLGNPYTSFLSTTDVSIVPKHILEKINPPRNIKVAEFGTKPVASGPYKLKTIKTIKNSDEITLEVNEKYYGKKPYISEIVIKTYGNYSELTSAYARREVTGIEKVVSSELGKKREFPNMALYELAIPQFDALYFNYRNGISKEKAFREAVSLAVNRKEISQKVYDGYAVPIYSPILPGYLGYDAKVKATTNEAAAKEKIAGAGFVLGSDGIFAKGEQKASARLVVLDDAQKIKEAEVIKETLARVGIEVKIEKYPLGALIQDHVRPRDFDILLISQNLGFDPDIYPFWHSSQANDPGLNFSGFSNRMLDKFLEQARTTVDVTVRKTKYSEIAKIIIDEPAAVYLLSPSWEYGVSRQVKGIEVKKLVEPKDRFWNIENWYILEQKLIK